MPTKDLSNFHIPWHHYRWVYPSCWRRHGFTGYYSANLHRDLSHESLHVALEYQWISKGY